MILRSLHLRNIRSYSDQRIDFPEGSVLLAGDIGSGKSSVLQAVEFALFGARRDSISGDALLRKGCDEGEVVLGFGIGKRDVVIRRALKRQGGSVAQVAGSISVDGQNIDATATELKARILALLGYPVELLSRSNSLVYRYTVYTPQEDMKQIVMEAHDQRIDTLRKVFGIDRYKRIAENATLYIRKVKESRRELAGVMAGIDEKRKELEAKGRELKSRIASRDDLVPVIDDVRRRKDDARSGLAELESRVKRINEIRSRTGACDARLVEVVRSRDQNSRDIALLEEQILSLKAKLESVFLEEKDYPSSESVEKEISSAQKEIERISTQKAELSGRRAQLIERIAGLDADIEGKSSRLSVSREKEALYTELLEQLKDKQVVSEAIAGLNISLKNAETVSAELSAGMKGSEGLKEQVASLDTCPTCRQEVSSVHKQSIIEQEERRLRKIRSELEHITEEKKRIEMELKEHDARMDSLVRKEQELFGIKADIMNLSTVKEELEKAKSLHSRLCEEKKDILSALEKLDDKTLDFLKKELKEKQDLLRRVNEHNLMMKEKKHNLASLAEKQERLDALKRSQETLKDDVRSINKEKLVLGEELSALAPAEQEFRKAREGLDRLSDEEKKVEVLLGEKNKEIEGLTGILNMLKKDVEEKELAKDSYESFGRVQEWLEKMFLGLMSTMERHIMAKVHSQFSELFTTWFDILVEDDAISVRIDETFTPRITQNGHDTSINHLSGGEKTSIALAYRLALNKVINDLMTNINTRDLLILDEPTDGFSSQQLDKVRDVLSELGLKQTIIVSHEAKIESFVDHVIRINKTDHVSRVV